ncbi:MAG: 4Fe-4S binding protein [Candidatus Lokiarchaeota archaeon]|nr:4Fe-4S binding protein [Candidatus Lokiarchaeota archaeon]MBD3199045.1 4Fe-4S binding protein [Candidatus Lokiarchaeota archaeon]
MIQQLNPSLQLSILIPMFILWIILSTFSTILIYRNQLKRIYAFGLYLISIAIGGIILGGVPNAIMPIQQIIMTIGLSKPFSSVIPMIIILGILLASTIFFGRIFCGFACPFGALQEFASKVQFKSNIKHQKKVKYTIQIPKKVRLYIRGIFFIVFLLLGIIWAINLIQLINPFLGFSFFTNPFIFTFWMPFVLFVVFSLLSFFIYRPWCTLVCPFGVLANITSRISITKLRRTEDCTECSLCESICPMDEAARDSSKGECYLCNRCVDVCPQNAIKLIRN